MGFIKPSELLTLTSSIQDIAANTTNIGTNLPLALFLLEYISELIDALWLVRLSPDTAPEDVPLIFSWRQHFFFFMRPQRGT